MSDPVLQTLGLGRAFGGHQAVQDLTLSLPAGRVLGLLGPNGAGKTTTVRMISTVIRPTAGTARVCGLDVVSHPAQARRLLSYIPQEKGVRHLLTGREALEFEADLNHVPAAARDTRVNDALRLVDLTGAADRRVSTYSGGMAKRLDLACGLLTRPRLLILDEPTLALDVAARHRIWRYLLRLRDSGTAVLLATNYLDEAEYLCDTLCILDEGRPTRIGRPQDLKTALAAELVVLETPGPADLLRLLREQGLAAGAVLSGPAELSVPVGDAAREIPRLLQAAALGRVTVTALHHRRASLDDVFRQHTHVPDRLDVPGGPGPDLAPTRSGPVTRLTQETRAFLLRAWRETTRERLRLVLTVLQPAVWLLLLGTAIGRTADPARTGTPDYPAFMLAGLLVLIVLGVAVDGALPLVWDRETGYLARLLSLPITRGTILASRIVHQTGMAILQSAVAVAAATLLGVRIESGPGGLILIALLVALMTATLTSLLIALALSLRGHTTFLTVSGFLSLPLLFASTAFVPAAEMPTWMRVVATANPLTLMIDTSRALILTGRPSGLAVRLGGLLALTVASLVLAALRFRTFRNTLT